MSDADKCGCCEGVSALTPCAEDNPPGQTSLKYRVGSHGRFRESMLADLARQPDLAALTTRSSDDPALALVDAWSALLDVLSFYQERTVQEGFLRTASERRSVLELARAIGYELRPGVAASTFLAFNLETSPGAPPAARIAAGTRAQSIPAQDEKPQVFETLETIQARSAWNALEVRHEEPFLPYWGCRTLYLRGQNTRLQNGDTLLIIGDERRKDPGSENWDFRRVERLLVVPPGEPTADPLAGCTVVTLERPLGSIMPGVEPAKIKPRCFALRTRASLFGQGAPDWKAMPRSLRASYLGLDDETQAKISLHPQWPGYTLADVSGSSARLETDKGEYTIHLDASYSKLVPGSWVVLSIPEYQEVYEILSVSDDARALFTLSTKTTRLTLRGEQLRELFNDRLRETTVYGESAELAWAPRPLSGFISGHSIDLTSLQPELAPQGWIAVSGLVVADEAANLKPKQRIARGDALAALEIDQKRRSAAVSFSDGSRYVVTLESRSEVVRIRRVLVQDGHTRLELESDLGQAYLPPSVRVNANVTPASHGDSRQMQIQPEILGGGDGSRSFQRFTLRQKPLTYVAAATPSGTASTLEVRVDGVRWQEAPRITAMASKDRSYLVRRGDDGSAAVQFGDGSHGARLPSGQTNLEARYRVGIGAEGNLDTGQISLLLTRPLGVKEVSNPVPASGGSDPESLERARRNAPLTVLTLDRIVSLQDFEDFATAFTGIGKAQAVWLWNGESRLVHVTVSGIAGEDIDPASALYRNLAQAIDAVRPAHQLLRLEPGRSLLFGLAAKIRVNGGYDADKVLASARSALQQAFGFEARSYGQSLSGSELLAVLQAVAGIQWVDLDSLHLKDGTQVTVAAGPDGRLRARRARWQGTLILPAEMLLIDPAAVTLTEITP